MICSFVFFSGILFCNLLKSIYLFVYLFILSCIMYNIYIYIMYVKEFMCECMIHAPSLRYQMIELNNDALSFDKLFYHQHQMDESRSNVTRAFYLILSFVGFLYAISSCFIFHLLLWLLFKFNFQ